MDTEVQSQTLDCITRIQRQYGAEDDQINFQEREYAFRTSLHSFLHRDVILLVWLLCKAIETFLVGYFIDSSEKS